MRVATTLALLAALYGADAAPRVDPRVHRTLKRQGTANVMVTMKQTTRRLLEATADDAETASRGDKIAGLVQRLQDHASTSQESVLKLVAQEERSASTTTRSFWITNQVYFQDATPELVEKLSASPDVDSVREEEVYELPDDKNVVGNRDDAPVGQNWAVEWGIKLIHAPEVWDMGYSGKGVVVGGIDTGVLATHETLKDNFRREFGWYDPQTLASEPYDDKGHGTHAMGTTLGLYGIGVAPSAQWIACKGCTATGCAESDLVACMEFMTCPTDTTGKTKDCSKAPHVVNNSWGGSVAGDTKFQGAIDAWHAAGIIPVFSAGNRGPECKTSFPPAEYANVIAVGAIDETGAIGSFSSRGPTVGGLMKPEISAAGVNITSASNLGDAAYEIQTGTSMAAPHVTGTVALMLSARPGASYDQVRKALLDSAVQTGLKPSNATCGARAGGFPNNAFGHGRVDALAAVKKIRKRGACGAS